MKKVFLLSFTLLTFLSSKAQTIQTYKGVFESGSATYQYFENDKSDRIYNGSFNYVGNPYSFVGQFKDNKRNGKWKISALNKIYKNEKGKIQVNTNISGKYILSSMDSIWTYTNAIKTYNPKTKKPSPKAEITKSTANFKNNHFSGKFTYEKGITTKTTVVGQFNENGFPDGVWITKSLKEIEEIKYQNGILLSRIVKDITTGDKKVNEDNSVFVNSVLANLDSKTLISTVSGKMYFIDTVEFQNILLAVWQKDLLNHDVLGNIINPLYSFKRSHIAPIAYQIIIIECEGNSDCLANYNKSKSEELVKIQEEQAKQAEEAEKLRLEALAKEEQIRIEKEKELERQRVEQLANAEKIGDEFFKQKKFKSAINQYAEVNKMEFSQARLDKISACEKEIAKIDSLHKELKNKYIDLKNNVNPTFENAAKVQPSVKAKKKVYGANYLMCVDFLKTNFMPQFEALKTIENSSEEELEFWTEKQEKLIKEIDVLKNQLSEVTQFYTSVNDAVTKNNKSKLRVLNSSLNPKVIVHDMINFK
ncbi:MAG: hypothetical protein ACK5B9_09685 [Flavobacteriia bacterium]